MLLGLTGLYCAGKNFAGGIFEEKGFAVLDVDKLGHIALENKKKIIKERFGRDILKKDGSVDRRALGMRVFGKPEELAVLENIVHPEANRLTCEWLNTNNDRPCVINAALLHRSTVFSKLDAIIFIKAPLIVRMLRAKKRDNLSWKEIWNRFSSQRFGLDYDLTKTCIYYINNWWFDFSLRSSRIRLEKRIDEVISALRG
jgi:dephospho-CoA kinase